MGAHASGRAPWDGVAMSALASVASAVFWGALVLSVLVFVHELGHYLAARFFGMRVTEFFLGMPCRLKLSYKSRTRGTEIGVTPVLLGGYTRICGMEGSQDELLAPCLGLVQSWGGCTPSEVAVRLGIDEERALSLLLTLSDWASIRDCGGGERFETLPRDADMLTEYDRGHDLSAAGSTTAGAARPIAGDLKEFLAAERGRTYLGHGFISRVLVLVAGPALNVLLALLIVTFSLSALGVEVAENTNVMASVSEGGYAWEAGVRPGDKVISIDGAPVDDWSSIVARLHELLPQGKDLKIRVISSGEERDLVVDLPDGQPVDVIGIAPPTLMRRLALGEAFRAALRYAAAVGEGALRLITPRYSLETLKGTSSVVGISAMASKAASQGPNSLLLFAAVISLSLGFMNLLPIPPLDGGKVAIELVQLIVRRPLSVRVQNAVSYVGLALFLALFVFALRNDIGSILAG